MSVVFRLKCIEGILRGGNEVENSREKRFYEEQWFWVIVMVIVICLTRGKKTKFVICGNGNGSGNGHES